MKAEKLYSWIGMNTSPEDSVLVRVDGQLYPVTLATSDFESDRVILDIDRMTLDIESPKSDSGELPMCMICKQDIEPHELRLKSWAVDDHGYTTKRELIHLIHIG